MEDTMIAAKADGVVLQLVPSKGPVQLPTATSPKFAADEKAGYIVDL